MNRSNDANRHRFIFIVLTLVAIVGLTSGTAFADIHIVLESTTSIGGRPSFGDDEDGQEIFMGNGRVLIPSAEGEQFLFLCDIGEFAMLTRDRGHYWQGTVDAFLAEVQDIFDMVWDEPFDWVDEMYGTGRDEYAFPIRTVPVGTERVDGYDTVHYRVEFEKNGAWQLYEELWLAPDLLKEIEAEVGPCFNHLVQEGQTVMVGLAIGEANDMWYIMTSPEYRALFEEGFPVRSASVVEQFGTRIETTTTVGEVGREALPEDMFVIPEDALSITLLEAMM